MNELDPEQIILEDDEITNGEVRHKHFVTIRLRTWVLSVFALSIIVPGLALALQMRDLADDIDTLRAVRGEPAQTEACVVALFLAPAPPTDLSDVEIRTVCPGLSEEQIAKARAAGSR